MTPCRSGGLESWATLPGRPPHRGRRVPGVTVPALTARAADGTTVGIHTTNSAETGGAPGGSTRPTSPLAAEDLERIAELPDPRW